MWTFYGIGEGATGCRDLLHLGMLDKNGDDSVSSDQYWRPRPVGRIDSAAEGLWAIHCGDSWRRPASLASHNKSKACYFGTSPYSIIVL